MYMKSYLRRKNHSFTGNRFSSRSDYCLDRLRPESKGYLRETPEFFLFDSHVRFDYSRQGVDDGGVGDD